MERVLLVALLFIAISACASAPVQEMSDARQALQAAEAVNASLRAPGDYTKAKQHLHEAETALHSRDYRTARKQAVLAKTHALKARSLAVEGTGKN